MGWKDTTATFVRELKNLKAADWSDIKTAARRGFELLNQYRLIYNNDTYGQVRAIQRSLAHSALTPNCTA